MIPSAATEKIPSDTTGDFFFRFVLCSYFFVLDFTVCPYRTLHTDSTNIHASGGIQTRNPTKRSAADPRLRPFEYWGIDLDPPAISALP
jgi:hypothetical protein